MLVFAKRRPCLVSKRLAGQRWAGQGTSAQLHTRFHWHCTGTGIFLPLGKPLFLADRPAVERAMPMVLKFPRAPTNNATWRHADCLYAALTRDHGYDTLVMANGAWGSPEVVATGSACMDQTVPLRTGCVPSAVGLRAGWQGSRPCQCSEAAAEGLDHLLNCAGPNGLGLVASTDAG